MELSPEMVFHGFGFVLDFADFVLLIVFILLSWKWKSEVLDRISEKFVKVSDKYRDDNRNDLSDIRNDMSRLTDRWNRLQHSPETPVPSDSGSDDDGWASGALDDLLNRYPHSD